MDNIENLRKKYYEAIILLQDEQDILDSLPQPDYTNFFPIITGLIKRIEEELYILQQELHNLDESDIEMHKYFEEEIEMLLFKQEVCNNLLDKGKEEIDVEVESEKTPKKNIIFATTNSGNICIENDIKTVPEEYYVQVINMLQNLQDGIAENNNEKAKTMTSTHKKMAGLKEVKEFKVRLFYKILSSDTVYVLLVRMKKSDNDALDRKEAIRRSVQRNKQYLELKKQVKDQQMKEKLIAENEQILSNLYEYLNQNKRGK